MKNNSLLMLIVSIAFFLLLSMTEHFNETKKNNSLTLISKALGGDVEFVPDYPDTVVFVVYKNNRLLGKAYPHYDHCANLLDSYRFSNSFSKTENLVKGKDYDYDMSDVIFNGKSMGKYEATVQGIRKVMKENPELVGYMIYLDKVKGKAPWQVNLIQTCFESAYLTSTLAKEARNTSGIKCVKHSDETHKKWWREKTKSKTCMNFNDDSRWDHFQVFPSFEASIARHAEILEKPRYRSLKKVVFNEELQLVKVRYGSSGAKLVKYQGILLKPGTKLYVTGIDAYFALLRTAGYATDPLYADKLAGAYFSFFGSWLEDDWKFAEQHYLEAYYQSITQSIAEVL